MAYKLLIINPGSTSTKIGVYEGEKEVLEETLRHSAEEILKYATIFDQLDFRKEVILKVLKEKGIDINELDAVVGRGGMLKPIEGGTYEVNEAMVEDLKIGVQGPHASNLGGILSNEIAKEIGKRAFIVDPVVVDEMEDVARLSGVPELPRKSKFHALNQKAVAKRYAKEHNTSYEDVNLIVVHMGGGVSVGAHRKGRVIDVNNALDGNSIAQEYGRVQKVYLRITPGVEAHTHEYIKTGQLDSKFGFPVIGDTVYDAIKRAMELEYIELNGLHCHIGSQIFDLEPFEDTTEIMLNLINDIK